MTTFQAKVLSAVVAFAITMAFFFALSGCAHRGAYAQGAQLADIASTAIALGQGAEEANPILAGAGPVGMVVASGVKLVMPLVAARLPHDDCVVLQDTLFGLGAGAALGNLSVVAGAASAWPVALPAALLTGWWYHALGGVRHDCLSPAWQQLFDEYHKHGFQKA